jgi:diacylglycerol kinase family enzyme
LYSSGPRVYNGYIDYIPYEATDTTVNSSQITPNTSIAQLHQHLLPLNESLPTNSTTTKWHRINGPFAHVLITSKGSISRDVVASSASTLSDGYLTLQFIRSDGSTRMNLAKTFTKLSDGKHFDYDFVEWMRIRAFRIVPDDTNGNIMVDGEKVPYGNEK